MSPGSELSRRKRLRWRNSKATRLCFKGETLCLRHAPDADDSLEPTTNTSAPQHFDCKDRHSALYPAAASYIACVVLLPLSLAVDPRYSGMKYFREKSWEQKCAIEEKNLLREWRDQQVRISRALAICWQISGYWRMARWQMLPAFPGLQACG